MGREHWDDESELGGHPHELGFTISNSEDS